MSARKPDAWLYSICGDYRFAETREEAEQENLDKEPEERWLKPLYALSESDLEAIRKAAALLEQGARLLDYMGDPGDSKEHRALVAALRSIVEDKS